MLNRAKQWLDRFRGSGDLALTIPALDGVFRPNDLLEKAPFVPAGNAPDNLAACGDRMFLTDGSTLLGFDGERVIRIADLPAPVTALTGDAVGGKLIAGLAGGQLALVDPTDGKAQILPVKLEGDATAIAMQGDTIIVAIGSSKNGAEAWARDLLERNVAGAVWRVDQTGARAERIAGDLAWPGGLLVRGDAIIVAEAWKHRIVGLTPRGVEVLAEDLPGYPSRMTPAANGGTLLAVAAPRNQLVEFVLREETYRLRMLAEIDPRYWVAPTLAPVDSFLEPMQESGQRTLGRLKPWAATRSYGLAVRFDADFTPVQSFHSRADGTRHGVTSVVELNGNAYATTRGARGIVRLGGRPLGGA